MTVLYNLALFLPRKRGHVLVKCTCMHLFVHFLVFYENKTNLPRTDISTLMKVKNTFYPIVSRCIELLKTNVPKKYGITG